MNQTTSGRTRSANSTIFKKRNIASGFIKPEVYNLLVRNAIMSKSPKKYLESVQQNFKSGCYIYNIIENIKKDFI